MLRVNSYISDFQIKYVYITTNEFTNKSLVNYKIDSFEKDTFIFHK